MKKFILSVIVMLGLCVTVSGDTEMQRLIALNYKGLSDTANTDALAKGITALANKGSATNEYEDWQPAKDSWSPTTKTWYNSQWDMGSQNYLDGMTQFGLAGPCMISGDDFDTDAQEDYDAGHYVWAGNEWYYDARPEYQFAAFHYNNAATLLQSADTTIGALNLYWLTH